MDDNSNNDENISCGSISHEGEEEPTVGMVFDSLDDAWKFWGKYGKRMGFSVRKEQTYKSPKEGRVTIAYYVCSKEGRKKIDKRRNNSVHRWETRTGCMVKLSVGYDRDVQKYKIRKFIKDHNHPLEITETSHMLRSNRKVTKVHESTIDVVCSVGLAPTVDASQWVSSMTSMMLRATYYASASKEIRSIVTKKYMDVCEEIYAMQHPPSRDAVDMPSGLQCTSDAGKELAKRTGKRKTKRYKSEVELREGKGKKCKVLKVNREYLSLRTREYAAPGLFQTSHSTFGGEWSGSQSQTSHRTNDGMQMRDFAQNH